MSFPCSVAHACVPLPSAPISLFLHLSLILPRLFQLGRNTRSHHCAGPLCQCLSSKCVAVGHSHGYRAGLHADVTRGLSPPPGDTAAFTANAHFAGQGGGVTHLSRPMAILASGFKGEGPAEGSAPQLELWSWNSCGHEGGLCRCAWPSLPHPLPQTRFSTHTQSQAHRPRVSRAHNPLW